MSTKSFTRRDSATSVLRKMGVNSRDYNLFITLDAYGKFELNLDLAKAHVAKIAEQTAHPEGRRTNDHEAKPAAKTSVRQAIAKALDAKPAAATTKDGEAVETISQMARRLILASHSNKEVWEALVATFQLDQKKRGYPAWYRFELRKQGHKV